MHYLLLFVFSKQSELYSSIKQASKQKKSVNIKANPYGFLGSSSKELQTVTCGTTVCSSNTNSCCDSSSNPCCGAAPDTATCCASGCFDGLNDVCCDDDTACPEGNTCCDLGCCLPGEVCCLGSCCVQGAICCLDGCCITPTFSPTTPTALPTVRSTFSPTTPTALPTAAAPYVETSSSDGSLSKEAEIGLIVGLCIGLGIGIPLCLAFYLLCYWKRCRNCCSGNRQSETRVSLVFNDAFNANINPYIFRNPPPTVPVDPSAPPAVAVATDRVLERGEHVPIAKAVYT
eukprot:gene28640-37620_t